MEEGATLQDSITACKAFENASVDVLDISGGLCVYQNPHQHDQGYFKELSAAIKKEVNIPVILTGGIVEAKVAEQLLKEKQADMIGVGRAILKDSQWAQKAMHDL